MPRCGRCLLRPSHHRLDSGRSVFWLTEAARLWLHQLKFRGRFELLCRFDAELAGFDRFFDGAACVVPVPLHTSKYLHRSFNQAELIARRLAVGLDWECDVSGLRKLRSTEAQSRLGHRERQLNLKGSFSWVGGKPPERVLLVDDVWTTGETLEACARALKSAGCAFVHGWTLFRAPRHGSL